MPRFRGVFQQETHRQTLLPAPPDVVEHVAQDHDIAAQVQPHHQDDHRGQGPIHGGVPGREVDKGGEQGAGAHQEDGDADGALHHRRPLVAPGAVTRYRRVRNSSATPNRISSGSTSGWWKGSI